MKLIIKDTEGNSFGINGFHPNPVRITDGHWDIEKSRGRLDGYEVKLSDDSETLILTLEMERALNT